MQCKISYFNCSQKSENHEAKIYNLKRNAFCNPMSPLCHGLYTELFQDGRVF